MRGTHSLNSKNKKYLHFTSVMPRLVDRLVLSRCIINVEKE